MPLPIEQEDGWGQTPDRMI
jgi:hypothetical protein